MSRRVRCRSTRHISYLFHLICRVKMLPKKQPKRERITDRVQDLLQRGAKVAIWGWADKGQTVAVELGAQEKRPGERHGKLHKEQHAGIWSARIARPVGVRYAWVGFPKANLYNKNGLPALPFRTDRLGFQIQARKASGWESAGKPWSKQ